MSCFNNDNVYYCYDLLMCIGNFSFAALLLSAAVLYLIVSLLLSIKMTISTKPYVPWNLIRGNGELVVISM